MQKVRLNVLGLSYSQTQSGAYALILSSEESKHRIPIIIGSYEAQAIAIELEGLKPPRPLTHDLFVTFANAFAVNPVEVNIYKLEEGVFYSEIVLDNNYDKIRIDSRTSDAVALALRFKCPIFTTEDIISKAGIILDSEPEAAKSQPGSTKDIEQETPQALGEAGLSKYKLDELQNMLQKAIEEENYELASEIRDEINKRTQE